MQLEDVLVQVVEQQVQDWCSWHNWEIAERTVAEVNTYNWGIPLTLHYNVEITGMWVTTKKRELIVTVQFDEQEQCDVITGTVDNKVELKIPLNQVEIETVGPYTIL